MKKIRSRTLGRDIELPSGMRREEVCWILNNSAGDICYDPERLTNDELLFCMKHENRVTGLAKLRREARRRRLLNKE